MFTPRRPLAVPCLAFLAASLLPLHGTDLKRTFKILGQSDIVLIPTKGSRGSMLVTQVDGKLPEGRDAKQCTLAFESRAGVPMIKKLPAGAYVMDMKPDARGAFACQLEVAMDLPDDKGFFAYFSVGITNVGSDLKATELDEGFVDDDDTTGRGANKAAALTIAPDSAETKALKTLFLDFNVK